MYFEGLEGGRRSRGKQETSSQRSTQDFLPARFGPPARPPAAAGWLRLEVARPFPAALTAGSSPPRRVLCGLALSRSVSHTSMLCHARACVRPMEHPRAQRLSPFVATNSSKCAHSFVGHK